MSELKPCPFCGAKESDEHGLRLVNFSRNNTWGVECYQCEAMIGYTRYNTQEEAIEAWNRRYESSELKHTMEEFMFGQDVGNPEDGSL